jgi:hypothetical protein
MGPLIKLAGLSGARGAPGGVKCCVTVRLGGVRPAYVGKVIERLSPWTMTPVRRFS